MRLSKRALHVRVRQGPPLRLELLAEGVEGVDAVGPAVGHDDRAEVIAHRGPPS